MPTINPASKLQNTFGRRLSGAVVALLLSFAIAPAAHAQWEVHDAQANDTLNTIQTNTDGTHTETKKMNDVLGNTGNGDGKTINANLDAVNKKLFIGKYVDSQPGPRVVDPDQKLPASSGGQPLDNGDRCKSVAAPQKPTCQKIVDIQNAQYKYMLTMYENTNTRDAMLRTLMKEREAIAADDPNQYGKLEDNTNKLTALYNLIALDQQQMQTVNYAYEANLRYLRATQTIAANAAATGKTVSSWGDFQIPGIGSVDIGSAISGLITGAALTTALDGVQTTKPSGMKTLAIGESNGF